MLQLIYELRKNCCGRVDGWTGDIEGSTRGPRGPKNVYCERIPDATFETLSLVAKVYSRLGLVGAPYKVLT